MHARPSPKRVVYLWGAGATQAEISYLGARAINVLMRDSDDLGEGVATRILGGMNTRWRSAFAGDGGMDIEKLISLLTASGVSEFAELAEQMRRRYFAEIRNSLALGGVIGDPSLAIGLLKMHADRTFVDSVEVLAGIITTNHDGLLQVASQSVFKDVNIGFPFWSTRLTPALGSSLTPPILQLHGSFTWKFGVPIKVERLTKTAKYEPETVWIPPTILKEPKTYPFNKVVALAYEILARSCDVLRVVGASLTQNDWNILSLIFNAQRHRELASGTAFRIELIMSHAGGVSIEKECSYLRNITPIGFLSEGKFAPYKDDPSFHDAQMKNALAYWLKEKIRYHQNRAELSRTEPALATIAGDSP